MSNTASTPAKKHQKPRRSSFRPHLYDRKLEWRLQSIFDTHIRQQRKMMYFLLEECWKAGLLEQDIEATITNFEKLPATYSIGYLRGMLLSDAKRVESKKEEAIW